jgi:hypothetical protein
MIPKRDRGLYGDMDDEEYKNDNVPIAVCDDPAEAAKKKFEIEQ